MTYRLSGTGWADCTVCVDGRKADVSASYLSDALGDMARATVAMLKGADETKFSFTEEPGEFRWILRTTGQGRVCVRILWFDEMWGGKPDDLGKLVWEAECPMSDFGSAVLGVLQGLLDELGLEGYRDTWVQNEFPLESLRQMENMLKARPA